MKQWETIDIKYALKNQMCSDVMDNVCHIKALPWLSVVQAKIGSYDIKLGNHPTCNTGNGGFFIAPSGVKQTITHHNHPETGTIECRWIFLDVILDHSARFDSQYEFPTVPDHAASVELNEAFDALFQTTDVFARSLSYYRIINILHRISKPKKEVRTDPMLQVLAHIETNLCADTSVAQLAEIAHMSQSNFFAAFRKQFGSSPIAYINFYRNSIASELLKNTDDSITSIAEQVGFGDPLYFSKMFRKTHGLSPRKYREIYRSEQ